MATTLLATAPVEIVVGVGDCRVASSPTTTLATYALGSCIAITAWDRQLRVGGLLHVMNPDSAIQATGSGQGRNPFMYVDTGLPELLRQLQARGAVRSRLRCSMAGGASMMADSASLRIGKRNQLAIMKAAWQLGIVMENEDLGGTMSRSVRLDLANGRVDVRSGTGVSKILVPPYVACIQGGFRL
jgi:chemotaxis protein CheD